MNLPEKPLLAIMGSRQPRKIAVLVMRRGSRLLNNTQWINFPLLLAVLFCWDLVSSSIFSLILPLGFLPGPRWGSFDPPSGVLSEPSYLLLCCPAAYYLLLVCSLSLGWYFRRPAIEERGQLHPSCAGVVPSRSYHSNAGARDEIFGLFRHRSLNVYLYVGSCQDTTMPFT